MKENIFAYTKTNDEHYYPAFISINKYNTTGEVSITVRSEHDTTPVEVEITMSMEKLVDLAKEVLKFKGVVFSEQPAMLHYLALMEALEIPHPEWWIAQPPNALRSVACCVAKQAKDMYEINERGNKDEQK